MTKRPFDTPLPADLPEDWTSGQIVAPAGADVGLSTQHGYNYLMEQVNATQRAANAISESFDTISGKRTCRVTVGTSAAGWTQADCDYLCDGTDDQVELNAAIAAVQAAGGGEIALLAGEYKISEKMEIDVSIAPLMLSGEPGATVLNMAANINTDTTQNLDAALSVRFVGITFHSDGELLYVSTINSTAAFESCRFLGVGVASGTYRNDAQSGLLFRQNYIETSDTSGQGGSIVDVVANPGSNILVSENILKGTAAALINVLLIESDQEREAGSVVVSNNAIISTETGKTGIYVDGGGCLANNCVYNANVIAKSNVACVGNSVNGGGIMAFYSCTVEGNAVRGGNIVAGEYAAVTGNCVSAPANLPAIDLRRNGGNSTPAEETAIVVGNVVTAGSIGVHLTDEGMIGTILDQANALVACNRIAGCTTSIQIESNWSGCLVTGNMIDSPVVDNGSGNLVRLNSDDDGGGGSGTAGVTSFKGRSGVVLPMMGDYTASMVGARPDTWTPSAADVGAIPSGAVQSIQALTQAEYDALTTKNDTTLYLIKE